MAKNNGSETIPDDVWKKANSIQTKEGITWGKDYAGAWIRYDKYGDRDSDYGWEADHRKPVAKCGTDDLINLDPLQWENNVTKGDDYPSWTTSVSSEGSRNIPKTQSWQIKK